MRINRYFSHILCARTATMACRVFCIRISTKPYGDNILDSCKHNRERLWCKFWHFFCAAWNASAD